MRRGDWVRREASPEDHIQVDLLDMDNTRQAIAEVKARLDQPEEVAKAL